MVISESAVTGKKYMRLEVLSGCTCGGRTDPVNLSKRLVPSLGRKSLEPRDKVEMRGEVGGEDHRYDGLTELAELRT